MAQAGEQVAGGGLLPLTLQNAYRERYRAIRPGWRSSGDQLEAIVRSHVTPSSRVLRPGGHFVFLTPNMRNPLMVMNRIGKALPSLQRCLVPRFYGRVEADTFPVRYRANTIEALRAQAQASGLDVYDLRVVPDPTYLAVNRVMFRASVISERVMPKGWGVHLLGDLLRA